MQQPVPIGPICLSLARSLKPKGISMNNAEVRQKVVEKLLPRIEKEGLSWSMPWTAKHVAGSPFRPLRHNGQPYNGINRLILPATALDKGYVSPIWMTFKQAAQLTAHVKKGEKSTPIVYFDKMTKPIQDKETGEVEAKDFWFLKLYNVFNTEQIDGLPAHYTATVEVPREEPVEVYERIEQFVDNLNIPIVYGGNRACYSPSKDLISLPKRESFHTNEAFESTRFHELAHATRHKTRLDRDFGQKRFGDSSYALEEGVAELSSVFLAVDLGINHEATDDNAAYIKHWVPMFAKDPNLLFQICSHAQRATDWCHTQQKQQNFPKIVNG